MIDFSPPSIGKAEEDAVLAVLRSRWLTSGRCVAAFERDIESLVGRRAYATSSATMGLQALLLALGVGPGWKACFPAITFSSMPMQAFMLGATIQFCDVDDDGLMVIPPEWECADKQIVVPTHLAGTVADVALLRERVGRSLLIEDCAHLYPGFDSGSYIAGACRHSDYSIFSFYPTKCVATAEGGAITTAHDIDVASARLHGIDRDMTARLSTYGTVNGYDVVSLGTKANMSDVAAAIAGVQLQRREELAGCRRTAASWYMTRLANSPIEVLHRRQRLAGRHAEHLMVARFRSQAERNAAAARLKQDHIACSLHFQALHHLSFWRRQIDAGGVEVYGDLKKSEEYSERCLSLPIFADIRKDEVDRVCDILLELPVAIGS